MIYIIGHKSPDTDSVVSAIAYSIFKGKGYKPLIAGKLNNETNFILEKFGFDVPEICEEAIDRKFILVDHNEESQRIDGLNSDKIVEIVDHHKFNFQNSSPIEILVKSYGSTASIVAEKFFKRDRNFGIDKNLAAILLCAILSDTVIFKSPTTTNKDKELAQKLAKIAEIDNIEKLGLLLFNKKAEIASKSAEEIVKNDFKDFLFDDRKIGVGQLELVDLQDIKRKKDEILAEMNKMIDKDNYFSIILMITDIISEGSYLWVVGNREIILKKFKIKDGDFLKGVFSRKKQIVPILQSD
ncbi:MAG: manganese-dependent inorganic pyrophosphatase [Methanosarcinales archaeon]|nr:manganese-dependent inorganic pyrophosphatase [Methanosarcinales archaeon]